MLKALFAALSLSAAVAMTTAAEPQVPASATTAGGSTSTSSASSTSPLTGSSAATAPVLKTEYAFTVRASLAAPIVVGNGPEGLRRFIPITGGTFAGPLMSGKVVPGSGDWQVVRPDGVLAVEARYTLETSDGVLIAVNNQGIRQASADIMAKLTRGEPVPPTSYYFRTAAQFEAPLGSKYEWANQAMFVATAEREPNTAVIHFFKVL